MHTSRVLAAQVLGKVKWWNDAKGYGFIEMPVGEDVFVHYTAIQTEGFKTLKEGETVRFDLLDVQFPSEKETTQAANVVPLDRPQPKRLSREERSPRKLWAFLCHASADKTAVRQLHKRLSLNNVNPWLDEKDLLPGQDWNFEIARAVRSADVVLACLSKHSVTKEGFVQKEMRLALELADEKPEGTIYFIPVRLEECQVPERLKRWHWVDYYEPDGYSKLLASLRVRADSLELAEVR